MATDETLTALCIPQNEPTTLLHHVSLFPVTSLQASSSYSGPVTTTPPSLPTDSVDEEALLGLPISQLCSLSLLAYDSPRRSTSWTSNTLHYLGRFPFLSPSVHANGRDSRTHARWHWMEKSVARPTFSYCTQACLRGLAQHGSLDDKHPNYRLHKEAASRADLLDISKHAITQAQLSALIRERIDDAPEHNCQCLSDRGYYGAIGQLSKIALAGFGYTGGQGSGEVSEASLARDSHLRTIAGAAGLAHPRASGAD